MTTIESRLAGMEPIEERRAPEAQDCSSCDDHVGDSGREFGRHEFGRHEERVAIEASCEGKQPRMTFAAHLFVTRRSWARGRTTLWARPEGLRSVLGADVVAIEGAACAESLKTVSGRGTVEENVDQAKIFDGRHSPAADGHRPVENQVTQTVRRLEKMIQSGQLAAGRMLPSQRLLAEQLNVGRSSLREALSILETLGVVQTKPRLGTMVRQPTPDDPKPEWGLKGTYTPEEVYQFRIVIESYAARRTAINASPDQIAELREICDLMREAAREGDLLGYTEQDFAFHQRIMSFSDNRLFTDLHQRYGAVFRESQRMPLAWHRALWEPLAEHENIIRAIENRDPENASYFARVHLVRGADRIGVMLSDSV